jgi:hypothetical protein
LASIINRLQIGRRVNVRFTPESGHWSPSYFPNKSSSRNIDGAEARANACRHRGVTQPVSRLFQLRLACDIRGAGSATGPPGIVLSVSSHIHVQKILYQKILLSAFSMCCPALSLPAQQQIRAEQNHGPYASE